MEVAQSACDFVSFIFIEGGAYLFLDHLVCLFRVSFFLHLVASWPLLMHSVPEGSSSRVGVALFMAFSSLSLSSSSVGLAGRPVHQ